MKKNYSLLVFVLCLQFAKGSEVPNSGFENWSAGNPVGWYTSNIPGSGFPITQYSPGNTGSYSAKGQAVIVVASGDTIAPVLVAGGMPTGTPITTNYEALEFYYQANLSGGDILSVKIFIYDGASYIIGEASEDITVSEGGWMKKTLIISYSGSTNAVKALIEFVMLPDPSSGRAYPLPSSSFLIDNVELTGSVDVKNLSGISNLEVFPVPAHDILNIKGAANQSGSFQLMLTDALGRVVIERNSTLPANDFIKDELNLQGIASGCYSLMIVGEKGTLVRKVIVE